MMGVVVGRIARQGGLMGKPCWTLGTTAPNVVIVEIPVKAGGGVVISKWGRNAIVAAGLLRQLSVEVDAALLRQSQEAEDEPED